MIKAIIFDFGRVISSRKPLSLFRKYEIDPGLGFLPSEAVFIDNADSNVKAARKLGIRGILFTNASELEHRLNHLLVVENE